jgi:omega-amidase
MKDLAVAYIQSDIHWESTDANLAMFEEKIWQLDSKVDCIVLPEMFTTGFSMTPELLSEPMNSKTFRWMKQQAAQTNALIIGSYIVVEKSKYYNRLLAVMPDGTFHQYDKKHLYSPAGENIAYTSGQTKLVFDWRGWNICPMVCYDLRFPVFSRSVKTDAQTYEYDALIYIASWPIPRIKAWDVLLQARAIENLSYVVGVNRLGQDGNGMDYPGHSAVYNFKGESLASSLEKEENAVVHLSASELTAFRTKHPFQLDADSFNVH